MSDDAVQLSQVRVAYGRSRALDGLSLSVPRGAVLGLVGSNGAGKTTALCAMAGLLTPSEGRIDLLGLGPFDAAQHAGRVSLLPQDAQLPPHARAGQLLRYYARLQGMPASDMTAGVNSLLERVHLADRAQSAVRTLSHGMAQRLAIAQAFLGAPELVLLDEPLNGLDPLEVKRMREFLRAKPGNQTIVISSHLLDAVEAVCDEVAFIEKGRRVRQAGIEVLMRRDSTLTMRLEGTVPLADIQSALDGSGATVELSETGLRLHATTPMTAGDLNAVVLPLLLEHDVRILEITRGSSLEDQYLASLS